MSPMLAELKEKASQLPEYERAELALKLIESLDGSQEVGIEEARRVAEVEKGEVELIPGDEVFGRLRRRLG